MRELVVVSGKGGTGKTSITASLASLAGGVVLADCDVDAADLHLVLRPEPIFRRAFRSGHKARVNRDACTGCAICLSLCRYGAVRREKDGVRAVCIVDDTTCEGCGVCVDHCPANAISFDEQIAGEWFVSETRHGPMIHARLGITAENSGKLVSLVRTEAKMLAAQRRLELVLIDGPPGIGCPVIASITGASEVLIVAEPTVSGAHDLRRVAELARHFRVPARLCVNKWDINPGMAASIEGEASALGIVSVGRIRYDTAVTTAQIRGLSVVEMSDTGAAADMSVLWENLQPLAGA